MTRIDLTVRAICEYAQRQELSLSPAGLVLHRGDPICDNDALRVIDLLDDGVLREDGDLIVPALVADLDLDEVLARYRIPVSADLP